MQAQLTIWIGLAFAHGRPTGAHLVLVSADANSVRVDSLWSHIEHVFTSFVENSGNFR